MSTQPHPHGARSRDDTGDDSADDTADGRAETPNERADRNWNDVLQELRVLQTGTQIITGFLLALAFQPAFADLTAGQRTFYLTLVVGSALSAIVALAPVALHRFLFRHRAKQTVVAYGHAALMTALLTVSLLLVGVVAFIFEVVVGDAASWTAGIVLGVIIAVLWVAIPLVLRAQKGRDT
ncbi:hypothetical protein MSA03_02110 [Microbacterium saccharophilum]|uniref:DUF6328 family protein n=1 Tax=Microbacterium saccharophilum TaxID=1213358 RepID=UPI0011971981|nr:DUF6328 family protein [Microbacterium saccharophilum]GEP46703.1 hypothetical protein MSA03_02110 [Microbacterium saccharophilum]